LPKPSSPRLHGNLGVMLYKGEEYDRAVEEFTLAVRGGTTADGIADAAVLMAYEVRLRPEDLRFPDWLEAQWAKIARALDVIEAQWMPHLNGPLDMAHIAVGCVLPYLDFRHATRNWRAGRPLLAAWEAGFAARPAMRATAIPAA
jgi:glutathione S-transferase